jgi:hypothetical protein
LTETKCADACRLSGTRGIAIVRGEGWPQSFAAIASFWKDSLKGPTKHLGSKAYDRPRSWYSMGTVREERWLTFSRTLEKATDCKRSSTRSTGPTVRSLGTKSISRSPAPLASPTSNRDQSLVRKFCKGTRVGRSERGYRLIATEIEAAAV